MNQAAIHEPRIHYMDHLRALAMLAGVVFHAALAYSPLMHAYWPVADVGGSAAVDAGAWFLHLFRMPLFFVVSGFFAALLVRRRGMGGFFRHRVMRILLPLLLFWPLLLWSMHRLTAWAVATVEQPSPVLAWLREYVAAHGSLPFLPTLAHLWFLHYLWLFALLVWIVATLEFRRIERACANVSAIVVIVFLPLLLALPLASVSAPWPAPESPVPTLWALAFFGIHFALGYLFQHRPALLDAMRPFAPWLLLGALAAAMALPWTWGDFVPGSSDLSRHLVHAVLQAYAGLWMTLCCLLAGRAWLDRQSPPMRWLADASYWVYLVHLPLLFAIQYALLDVALPWPIEFAIATALTLALSFASYQWLVRPSIVGRLLNGPRS